MREITSVAEGHPENPRAAVVAFKKHNKEIYLSRNGQGATKTALWKYMKDVASQRAAEGIVRFNEEGISLSYAGRHGRRTLRIPTEAWIVLTVSLGIVAGLLIVIT